MKTETKCVHAGSIADHVGKGLNTPVYPSSAHQYLDVEEVPYPRYFNTANQKAVAAKISALEGGEAALVFSSGLAAINSVLLALLAPGDHAVVQGEIYGGSYSLMTSLLDRLGINCTFVETDPAAMEAAIGPQTKLIFIETPTNPLLSILDIRAVADIARRHNCVSVIDNTFATPVYQRPLELGIDVVVHSGTKYLGGHSDLSCGAVITGSRLAKVIRRTAINLGGNLNALTCHLLERSLKTLAVRVQRQSENALALARFLDGHAGVEKVFYPGLPGHPGHELAAGQMSGFGAMLSFIPAGPAGAADSIMRRLEIIVPAVSLGGVESTICDPARTSHSKMPAAERARQGISDNLLRLSAGIENIDDLVEDLRQALEG